MGRVVQCHSGLRNKRCSQRHCCAGAASGSILTISGIITSLAASKRATSTLQTLATSTPVVSMKLSVVSMKRSVVQ